MDQSSIALLIPIMGLVIGALAVVSGGIQKVWKLRLEEARVRAGTLGQGGSAEIDALRAEVADLRQELQEVEERLDFAERALVQSREPGRLPDGRNAN
jgi:NAD(P)H-dependent flavin oxidoreductase YrpB (nitropropane dioxygenase family)